MEGTEDYKEPDETRFSATIEEQKELIKKEVGDDVVKILSDHGINVDKVVGGILKKKVEKQRELDDQAASPNTENTMTSELVYLSANFSQFIEKDIYKEEYFRRLGLIELSEEQIHNLYEVERLLLDKEVVEGRENPWVRRFPIMSYTTVDDLPKPDSLTLSELVLITDDALAARSRDHEWMSNGTWKAVCVCVYDAKYQKALLEKTNEELDWSDEQTNAFIKNECALLERLKWSYHNKSAWTDETTNVEKYKK